jgi:hypothetical protein
MGVDFASQLYSPLFDMFSRPVVVYPVASQPGVTSYSARGIFDHNQFYVDVYDNMAFADGNIELDILVTEFPVVPMQRDLVLIPYADEVEGGFFEISDVSPVSNAGGEVTLTLKDFAQGKGVGYLFQVPTYDLGSPDFALPLLTVARTISQPQRTTAPPWPSQWPPQWPYAQR